MSGNSERRIPLQCPHCTKMGVKTIGWSVFTSNLDRGNFGRYYLVGRFEANYLYDFIGKNITRIRCIFDKKQMGSHNRHVIQRGEHSVFEALMGVMGFTDGIITKVW